MLILKFMKKDNIQRKYDFKSDKNYDNLNKKKNCYRN